MMVFRDLGWEPLLGWGWLLTRQGYFHQRCFRPKVDIMSEFWLCVQGMTLKTDTKLLIKNKRGNQKTKSHDKRKREKVNSNFFMTFKKPMCFLRVIRKIFRDKRNKEQKQLELLDNCAYCN